jgi:hypothetical protein
MNAVELLERTQRLGLKVEARDGQLAISPARLCPDDLLEELRRHKPAVLAELRQRGSVPPAELPLNPTLPVPTPADREPVIAWVHRQTGGEPGPLAAWIMRREDAYYDGPGRTWDCGLICYAACRDVLCWQTGSAETAVLKLAKDSTKDGSITTQ